MMDLAAAIAGAVMAISGPGGDPPPRLQAEGRAAQVRCRPAPYIVAERGGVRPKAQKALITGSRVPLHIRPGERRGGRPCHLMDGPGATPPPPTLITIAGKP